MSSVKKNFLIILLAVANCSIVFGQTNYWDAIVDVEPDSIVEDAWYGNGSLPMFNNAKGYQLSYSQSHVDLIVPEDLNYSYLKLVVRGGDGGVRKNANLHVEGGGGATLTSFYSIGNSNKQISPGDKLRFIVGSKGKTVEHDGTNGAYGGSGSGVFLQKKGTTQWITLMVAGGGGGAFADCCTVKKKGGSASITTRGNDGGGSSSADGGRDGDDGDHPGGITSQGGSGIHSSFENGIPVGKTQKTFYTRGNIILLFTHGGTGTGSSDPTVETGLLFGCGHGGGGDLPHSGCGGGGYSGGGSGGYSGSGGGGGSFYNKYRDMVYTNIVVNPQTLSPQDGHAIFRFMNTLPNFPADPAIHLASAPERCVDVESLELHDGNNMQLWKCKPYITTQSWNVDDLEIKLSYDDSKCINVDGGNTSNGANVRIKNCNNTNAQKWVYDGFTKQFRSLLDLNKCMNDAYGGRTDNGTNIQLWDCRDQGGASDQWLVEGSATISDRDNAKYIIPAKNTNLAVHSALYKELGSNIELWDKADDNAEKWYFDGMEIKLRTQQNLCIDLKSSNTSNGNNIQLWKCNGTNAQKWLYDGVSRSIRSVINPDKCMEVADGNFANHANIQINDCNGLMRQKFNIGS